MYYFLEGSWHLSGQGVRSILSCLTVSSPCSRKISLCAQHFLLRGHLPQGRMKVGMTLWRAVASRAALDVLVFGLFLHGGLEEPLATLTLQGTCETASKVVLKDLEQCCYLISKTIWNLCALKSLVADCDQLY